MGNHFCCSNNFSPRPCQASCWDILKNKKEKEEEEEEEEEAPVPFSPSSPPSHTPRVQRPSPRLLHLLKEQGGGGGDRGGEKEDSSPPPILSIFEKALSLVVQKDAEYSDMEISTQEEEKRMSVKASKHWRGMMRQLVGNSPLLPSEKKGRWIETLGQLIQLAVERVDPGKAREGGGGGGKGRR